jgi:hypothetical protein
MKRNYLILLLMALTSHFVYAANPISLNGELVISREPLTDPLPDGDLVAYMTIRGQDAKQIYEGIKVQDYPDACGVDGMSARVAGNLICYKEKGDHYLCSFGIRLTDGTLTLGKPC